MAIGVRVWSAGYLQTSDCEALCSNGSDEGPHGKRKVKVTLEQGMKTQKRSRYSFTLSLNCALDEGGWSTPHLGHFTLGKDPVPMYRRLDWSQSRSGWVRKISPPPGWDSRTVQRVSSRCTY